MKIGKMKIDFSKDDYLYGGNILNKRVGSDLLVWFKPSNQWVLLNSIHSIVLEAHVLGVSQVDAKKLLLNAGNDIFNEEEALGIVNNLYASFDKLLTNTFLYQKTQSISALPHHKFAYAHHFHFSNKFFSIYCDQLDVLQSIFPLFRHLEVPSANNPYVFFIASSAHKFELITSDHFSYSFETLSQLKHKLYVLLSCYFYNQNEADWMMFVHASAIVLQNKLILISAPSGSGKTTLAGLLHASGASFFSDDFVPVLNSFEALPFPASLSFKDKASLQLVSNKLSIMTGINDRINHCNYNNIFDSKAKVNYVLLCNYDPEVDCLFEEMEPSQALQIFIREGGIAPNERAALMFIKWIDSVRFFRIVYSDAQKALKSVYQIVNE